MNEGETLLYTAKPHWILYGRPVFGILVSLFFFGSASLKSFGSFILVLSLIVLVYVFLIIATTEYGLTDRRVVWKMGILRIDSQDIILSKVESVEASQSLVGKIFNYGDVVVHGTGGSSRPFRALSSPIEFKSKVQEQLGNIQHT